MWRSVFPFWCVLCGVALLSRLIQLFEQDNVIYQIINGSGIVFYVIALVACIACPVVFAIMRFYRNLFTGEGYLSFTLPVTTSQHIWVKLLTAMLTEAATLVVACVSVVVITFGEVTVEIGKAIVYLLKKAGEAWGAHLPLFAVEGLMALVLLFATEILMFYACISIGQQAKKNRVLASVGVYFGFYAIEQVLGTIFIVVATFIDWEPLGIWVSEHPFQTAHIVLCGSMVLAVVVGAVFYGISYWLNTHRLNLE